MQDKEKEGCFFVLTSQFLRRSTYLNMYNTTSLKLTLPNWDQLNVDLDAISKLQEMILEQNKDISNERIKSSIPMIAISYVFLNCLKSYFQWKKHDSYPLLLTFSLTELAIFLYLNDKKSLIDKIKTKKDREQQAKKIESQVKNIKNMLVYLSLLKTSTGEFLLSYVREKGKQPKLVLNKNFFGFLKDYIGNKNSNFVCITKELNSLYLNKLTNKPKAYAYCLVRISAESKDYLSFKVNQINIDKSAMIVYFLKNLFPVGNTHSITEVLNTAENELNKINENWEINLKEIAKKQINPKDLTAYQTRTINNQIQYSQKVSGSKNAISYANLA